MNDKRNCFARRLVWRSWERRGGYGGALAPLRRSPLCCTTGRGSRNDWPALRNSSGIMPPTCTRSLRRSWPPAAQRRGSIQGDEPIGIAAARMSEGLSAGRGAGGADPAHAADASRSRGGLGRLEPALGRYTNFVNLLELAALAVPAGFSPDGLPAGITLIGQAGSERRLCEIGTAWQRWTKLPLGATPTLPSPRGGGGLGGEDEEPVRMEKPSPAAKGMVRVAVAGARPVRPAAAQRLVAMRAAVGPRACRTASRYRFLALMDLKPPRPGLLRDEERAGRRPWRFMIYRPKGSAPWSLRWRRRSPSARLSWRMARP